ncbi:MULTISPECIES: immunity protein Imm33 domain-containing protein [unclassified Nocardioides]|uniref:immunity protein Imm33 domain-containing protein n=1 Tax=unclassified Nocardioides TaxID=2615069 RepID=UPI0006F2F0A9|nr:MULTISPECIES: hypothetical protein [unclassified Nocardioides]KRA32737.1 hypothetical protein ASD81_14585 [Nocardioides sp. Root614]KRA89389.1 hypothetical protein ASD84_14850 [Nocardioides sp. Root682]
MTDSADLSALLTHGGWELVDPRPTAASHPDTFEMPTPAELAALVPGSLVRAMFLVVTIADVARDGLAPYDEAGKPNLVTQVERMWAIVLEVDGDTVECALDNLPFGTHTRLLPNDLLRIPLSHLIGTGAPVPDFDDFLAFLAKWEADPENPRTDPTSPLDPLAAPRLRSDQQEVCERLGARAEPPWPLGSGLLAKNVTPQSLLVYGARFPADEERRDTGWVVFAENDDFETVSKTVGFTVATLQDMYQAHPAIWPYVALPTGWGFTLAAGTEHDVYPVEIED